MSSFSVDANDLPAFLEALKQFASRDGDDGDREEEEAPEDLAAIYELTDADLPDTPATNAKLVSAFMKKSGGHRKYILAIPNEYWCDGLVDAFMDEPEFANHALLHMPRRFITEARLLDVVRESVKSCQAMLLQHEKIPVELRNTKLVTAMLKKMQQRARIILSLAPRSLRRTQAFWNAAVQACWKAARYVPEEYQTWRMMVGALADSRLQPNGGGGGGGGSSEAKEDLRVIRNLRPDFRCRTLREAVDLAVRDPLFVPWEDIEALAPNNATVTAADVPEAASPSSAAATSTQSE